MKEEAAIHKNKEVGCVPPGRCTLWSYSSCSCMTCAFTLSFKYGTNVKIRFLKLDLVEHVWKNSSTQEFLFLRKRKEFDTLNVPFVVSSPSLSVGEAGHRGTVRPP